MSLTDILSMTCRSMECECRFDGKNLFTKPLSAEVQANSSRTSIVTVPWGLWTWQLNLG
jgi:hypothetical protein